MSCIMSETMIKNLFPIALILVTITLPGWTQDENNAFDYLPESNFLGGWFATDNAILLHPSEAAYLVGSDYQLLREYNLVWYATETYSNFNDELTIELFEFDSGNDAYGFYSLSPIPYAETDPETGLVEDPYGVPPPTKIDTIRLIGTEFLEGHKGRFYFRIRQPDYPETLIQAGTYLLMNLPGTAMPSDMVSILPADDRVMGTEKYFKGPIALDLLLQWNEDDVLGFDEYEWEAVAAEYRLGGGEYYLLVIARYDDTDTPTAISRRLLSYFQDYDFETIIAPPTSGGHHPRAFKNDFVIAFWPDGDKIWLFWDLTNEQALFTAIQNR